jgi:allophanate hydrolase subunit 2
MSTVIVHKAGLLTTVQDRGRYGYQRFGMPVSGAMDVFSLELANLLVSNDPGDACLEATISGPELEFTGATWIAITGADMDPYLNGQGIPMNTAVDVRPGDRPRFQSFEERLQFIYSLRRRDSCAACDGQPVDLSPCRYRRISGPGTHARRRAAAG